MLRTSRFRAPRVSLMLCGAFLFLASSSAQADAWWIFDNSKGVCERADKDSSPPSLIKNQDCAPESLGPQKEWLLLRCPGQNGNEIGMVYGKSRPLCEEFAKRYKHPSRKEATESQPPQWWLYGTKTANGTCRPSTAKTAPEAFMASVGNCKSQFAGTIQQIFRQEVLLVTCLVRHREMVRIYGKSDPICEKAGKNYFKNTAKRMAVAGK